MMKLRRTFDTPEAIKGGWFSKRREAAADQAATDAHAIPVTLQLLDDTAKWRDRDTPFCLI
jgi:hypothetical protein